MSMTTGTAKDSAGCGCGGACGGGQAGASAYVRPRFFSGMLLTEDDLQAIDDYTVAKRRLTNRHMFGPGVVCGLEVDCDPCAPGWLTVTPGYALDCCGNDIVVGCPERIDALILLDELRRRSPADCGDPCEDQPHRDYLLVARYDEQPADPVAPYAQDDCAVGDCEPSRLREGYRFELVCDVDGPEPSLFDRLRDCLRLGDDRIKEEAAILTRLVRLAVTQARATAAAETGTVALPEVPTAHEYDAAERDVTPIAPALELLRRSTEALTADAAHAAGKGPRVLTGRQRNLVTRRRAQLAETLRKSPQLETLPAVDRDRALRIIDLTRRDPTELAGLGAADRIWLAEGLDPAAAPATYTTDAERIRSRVLHELDRSGRGNCGERAEIGRLPLDRLDGFSQGHAETLARVFVSVVAGCLCHLVNPPCPTCAELRVPLARVRIEDCRVTDVCGLTRQWVLAPRTLGYWLPVVDVLRQLLLLRCCGDRRAARPLPSSGAEVTVLREESQQALSMLRSPADAPELAELFAVLRESSQVPPEDRLTPAPASPAGAAPPEPDRVKLLEAQVAELGEELRKLRAQGAADSSDQGAVP